MSSKVTGLVKRGEYWHYDFQIRGHRFCGSTGISERREAERWLAEKKKNQLEAIKQLDGQELMNFGAAATRWWNDKAKRRSGYKDMDRAITWLTQQIGAKKPLLAIDNNLVAQLVSVRLGEGVSNGTVNRTVTEPLRALMRYAKFIGQPIKDIDWTRHMLKEAAERVREMGPDEEERLFAVTRPDFHPIMRFLLATGIRRAEACNLEWKDVDFSAGLITVRGKGGTVDRRPLSRTALAILQTEKGNHPTRVFTYVVQDKRWAGQDRGTRKPIAPDTLSTAYGKARKIAGLEDLRLHDIRHTTASRVVRATGNLMAASKALGHKRITTTQRYAHLASEDVRAALNAAEENHAKVTQLPNKDAVNN
ncbi:MAG: site-specific integrase [Methylocystaceae bacterium]|nr:site-specific integrase [Methylocystaceae bacterium]